MSVRADPLLRPPTGRTLHDMPAERPPAQADIHLHLSPNEAELLRSAAKVEGVTVEEFVAQAVRAQAIDTMADRRAIYLDDDDWDALQARLHEPPVRNE